MWRLSAGVAFAAAFLMFLPARAISQPQSSQFTGNDLHHSCQSDNPGLQAACQMYIMGVSDGLNLGARLSLFYSTYPNDTGRAFDEGPAQIGLCIPDLVTYQQLVDIVKDYLVRHPARRQKTANIITFNAISEAFPC